MITRVHYENYKSFKELDFDLKKNKKKAKNLISIYGENGSGKSNIVDSFKILTFSTKTLSFFNRLTEIREVIQTIGDKENGEKLSYEGFKDLTNNFSFYSENTTISQLAKNSRMIDSGGDMVLEYSFVVNEKAGKYILGFDSDNRLVKESLSYVLDERVGMVFSIENIDDIISVKTMSDSIFRGREIQNSMKLEIEKFWGKHTFLSILNSSDSKYTESYIKTNISRNIFEVIDKFGSIFLDTPAFGVSKQEESILKLDSLDSGEIRSQEKEKLDKTEGLLYKYYSSLYADVKDVFYKTKISEDKLKYTLYFKKVIGGELKDIPFKLESDGTKRLLRLFPLFIVLNDPESVVVIDELDASIHDVLASSMLESIMDEIEGQLIFTTHNTLLLEILPPQSAYVISVDVEGNKRIKSLNDYENLKIAAHNNLQKKYREGAFGAIPYPMELCLQDFRPTED